MQGWIKLHRKMLDNPVVCKDSDHLAVWVYLLLNATHESYPALFRGEKITLEPGQLITGRKSISQKLGIDESKTQRIIKSLKNEQQIEQQTSNQNRLITIVRWDDYQNCEQQNEQRVNNECTTDEQRVNTNKNVKNVKNEKKDIYSDLPIEIHEPLRKYIEMRKGMGKQKAMTDRAIELLISKLNKLAPQNIHLQIAMLEEATMKNWLSVYLPKPEQSGNPFKDKLKEAIQNEQNGSNSNHVGYQGGLSKLLQEPNRD
jgi:hypothetical protein